MTNHSWSPYDFDLNLNAPINCTMLGWFESFLRISTSCKRSSIVRSFKPPITLTAAKCPDFKFFNLYTEPKLPSPTFSKSCQSTGALKFFNLLWWWSLLAAMFQGYRKVSIASSRLYILKWFMTPVPWLESYVLPATLTGPDYLGFCFVCLSMSLCSYAILTSFIK